MDIQALESLGKIAGIAGISIGALVLIFNSVIRKKIFPGLTKEQGYTVIRMIIIAASLMAVLGLAAWIYVDIEKNKRDNEAILVSKYITGIVKDKEGNPIVSAEVEVAQYPEAFDRTDANGKFAVRLNGKGSKYLDLVLKHKNYKLIRQKVKVDFDEDMEEIGVDQITMLTAYPPDPEEDRNEERLAQEVPELNERSEEPVRQNQTVDNRLVDVTLNYMGDIYDCALDLRINIAGQTYTPTGNSVLLRDLKSGNQSFSVTGQIDCGYEGSCVASGSGQVYIVANTNYYVMWNYNTCVVGIYDEQAYRSLSGL